MIIIVIRHFDLILGIRLLPVLDCFLPCLRHFVTIRNRLFHPIKCPIITVNRHLTGVERRISPAPRVRLLLALSESTLLLSVTCHAEKDKLTTIFGSS